MIEQLRYRIGIPLLVVISILLVIGLWFGGRAIVHHFTRHKATEGIVIDRSFSPAHDWTYLQPIPHENCTTVGKTTSCFTTYTYIPIPMHDPDRWSLRVRDADDTEDWLDVPEGVYQTCQLSAYYPGNGANCGAV